MLVFFINLNLRDFQVKFLALFLLFTVIDGFEWFWMESLLKNFQLMLEFLKAPFLGPTPFLLYINDLNDNVICDTVIYANDTTLSVIRHLICGNNLNWSLNLNLNKILWTWGKKWLVDFSAGKTQLVSFDGSNNNGSIGVKMDRSFSASLCQRSTICYKPEWYFFDKD